MARLQDYPSVTPTSSDKLLVVQPQGQGLVPYGSKLDSANPTGTGNLSITGDVNFNNNTSLIQSLTKITNYIQFPKVYVEDKVPYNFRQSGNVGDSEIDMLVGGTVAFNQLVQTTDTSITVTSGHKYLSKINNVQTVAISDGTAISINDGTVDNVHDLTLMFGSTIADYIYSLEQGTAGAGVAWFRNLFPKSYYAYNAGELMSVKTSAHVTVGFNQWDEVWEHKKGYSSGSMLSSDSNIASKNFIPCIPSTAYFFEIPSTLQIYVYQYNENKTFLSANACNYSDVITLRSDTNFIKIASKNDGYSGDYKNDICINLSWDGERNGEYEPYVKHEYALDSDLELRGIPKLDSNNKLYYDGDTYESNGSVTRKYGEFTFTGSEPWGLYDNKFFYLTLSSISSPVETHPINTSGLDVVLFTNKQIRVYISQNPSLTTSSDMHDYFKNGTKLIYELATPTTETADSFTNPQVVDKSGTEEYVDTREVAIPVGHTTKYQTAL